MMKGGREPHTLFRSCTWKNANEGVFTFFGSFQDCGVKLHAGVQILPDVSPQFLCWIILPFILLRRIKIDGYVDSLKKNNYMLLSG
jgi:hypothetical protein